MNIYIYINIYTCAPIHFKGLQKFVDNYRFVIKAVPYSSLDYFNSWFIHIPKVRTNSSFSLFLVNRKIMRKPQEELMSIHYRRTF